MHTHARTQRMRAFYPHHLPRCCPPPRIYLACSSHCGVSRCTQTSELSCAARTRPLPASGSSSGTQVAAAVAAAAGCSIGDESRMCRCVLVSERCRLLDRTRDLIIHGPAHRGANGAAMPADEHGQRGGILFSQPPQKGGWDRA